MAHDVAGEEHAQTGKREQWGPAAVVAALQLQILLILVTLGLSGVISDAINRLFSRGGEQMWLGSTCAFFAKGELGKFRVCDIGVADYPKGPAQDPRIPAEHIILYTERGTPVAAIFHDPENGGGRIVLYNRQGEPAWQAP